MSRPIVNIADLQLESWSKGTKYASTDASFGRQIGMTGMGISYNEVPPGKTGCPFHNHHVEDELFIVLEGEGTYRFGTESYPIKAGDVLGAPAGGREVAHQIINTGAVTLRYYGVSTKAQSEVVEYPDSNKFAAFSRLSDGKKPFDIIGQADASLDYWDGEDIGEHQ
jgi:uncharacterized cupin superfamily protein